MINYKRLFSACCRERGLDDDDDENDDDDDENDDDDGDDADDYDDDGQWSFAAGKDGDPRCRAAGIEDTAQRRVSIGEKEQKIKKNTE